MILGQDGIIERAKIGTNQYNKEAVTEELKLILSQIVIDKKGEATLQDVIDYFNTDPQYEYIVSLTQIATISGDIPAAEDVANATELFVIYKEYQFKIDSKLNITDIGIYTETPQVRETDIGVKHIENDEWIAEKPTDNWFANKDYYDVKWQGDGTQESPYLITSENELAGLSYRVANGETFSGKYFELTRDLSMGKHIWVPIGGIDTTQPTNNNNYYKSKFDYCFSGNFDGKGNSISGLYFDCSERDYGIYFGLFGVIKYQSNNNILISNIKIEDSYLSHGDMYTEFYGGAIVARSHGDSTQKDNIKVKIVNCEVNAKMNGASSSCKTSKLGGICGYFTYGTIEECENKGIVSSGNSSGGIAGGVYYSIINKCKNNGGIIAVGDSYSAKAGGIVGDCNTNIKIINCVNEGNITINSNKSGSVAGGISGYGGDIYNSYNLGLISYNGNRSDAYIGGINGKDGPCYNCYNLGEVLTSKGTAGGIAGYVKSSGASSGAISHYSPQIGYCYFYRTEDINSTLNPYGYVRTFGYTNNNAKMLAYFATINDKNMVELDGTTEPDDYKGKTLLERLNYWLITNNTDGIYLSWIFNTEKGYPVFATE